MVVRQGDYGIGLFDYGELLDCARREFFDFAQKITGLVRARARARSVAILGRAFGVLDVCIALRGDLIQTVDAQGATV